MLAGSVVAGIFLHLTSGLALLILLQCNAAGLRRCRPFDHLLGRLLIRPLVTSCGRTEVLVILPAVLRLQLASLTRQVPLLIRAETTRVLFLKCNQLSAFCQSF